MKKILLYIWQLPQNLLGLLVILFTHAENTDKGYWLSYYHNFGVALGSYIIFGGVGSMLDTNVKHEQGHQKQSLYLGPLYLLIIGLPSITGSIISNIWFRFSDKNSQIKKKIVIWYYNLPWESWADKLGGVNRGIIDRR